MWDELMDYNMDGEYDERDVEEEIICSSHDDDSDGSFSSVDSWKDDYESGLYPDKCAEDYGLDIDDYDDEDEYLEAIEEAREKARREETRKWYDLNKDTEHEEDDEYVDEDYDDDEDDEDEDTSATSQEIINDRISSDFIKRDREKEKNLGIEDVKFYCHWLYTCTNILIINGELITKNTFTAPFKLRASVVDEDGDMIMMEENFAYTGGAGFVCKEIKPLVAFNRYPFAIELHISPEKLSKCTVSLEPIMTGEPYDFQFNSVTIDKYECKEGVIISDLQPFEKFPKHLVRQIHQKGIELEELQIFFLQSHATPSNYFRNVLSFNYTYSGKITVSLLMLVMLYNMEDELVSFTVKRINEGKWKKEEDSYSLTIPRGERISHIDVVVTFNPTESVLDVNKVVKSKLQPSFAQTEEDVDQTDEEETADEEETPTYEPAPTDKYVWRKYVNNYYRRFANPNDYETRDEFDKGVAEERERQKKEERKTRRASYLPENVTAFCKVDIDVNEKKPVFYYSTGGLSLKLGDRVIVPYGADNEEKEGTVVSLGECYNSVFHFDSNRIKVVKRKLDDE